MATYPIKMLKDENNNPFVPLVSTECIKDPGGQSLDEKLAVKLESDNIQAGDNTINVSTSGNNVSITANLPAGSVLIDNLTTTTAGQGALDAHQGKVLKDLIPSIVDDLTSTDATKALSAKQGYTLNQKFNDYTLTSALEALIKQYILASHPIGSIEINVSGANPSTYLGGTWVAWGTGKVPVGVNTNDSDFNTVEKTGGSKTVSYTPAGTNSGGNVQGTAITKAQLPNYTLYNTTHKHVLSPTSFVNNGQFINAGYGESNAGSSGCWTGDSQFALAAARKVNGTTFPAVITSKNLMHTLNTTDSTIKVDSGGSGQTHTHSFTQPTFTGTTATLNIQQEYITCYMWKRTA